MHKHQKKRPIGVVSIVQQAVNAILSDVEQAIDASLPLRPNPVTNFRVIFHGEDNMSKLAKVQLSWTPSVSPDVTKQVLTVSVGANAPVVTELAATVATAGTFDVPQDTAVHAELVAVDEVGSSDKAVLDFTVGALEVPAAPTGLAYSITAVVDAPVAAAPADAVAGAPSTTPAAVVAADATVAVVTDAAAAPVVAADAAAAPVVAADAAAAATAQAAS